MSKTLRIVILDDDPVAGTILKAAASAHASSVSHILNPDELATAVASGCDLLFLDLVMPERDGIDVLRAHAASASSFPPLVLVSGLDAGILETAVHFARRLGFRVDGALCKPADILDVGRLLDNLGRRRSGRPGGSQQSLTQESSARCLEAIRNGELFLRYQPQIDLATGRTTGAEALVRWNHPEQGELQPLTFVPLLEEGGAASELAQYVLLRALSDTRQLRQTWPAFRVSVNVHASVLRAPEFVERLLSALRTENMPAGALCIEATETAIVDDAPDTLENLVKLRMAGVQLSIDDFGTGHSTLQQLLRLPVNEIKLDRSFVSRLETSAKSRALTHGVLHIAAALGASVVAEGIETSEVHATLREMGCGIGQGYLFARPLTLDALTSWLGQHVP